MSFPINIIEDLLKLLVNKYALPKWIASDFLLFVYCIFILVGLFKFLHAVIRSWRNCQLKKIVEKDLHPYFTHKEVYKYTKYYIPQYFQNISPTETEDLGQIYAAAARSKLMKEFLKKGLLDKSEKKYFIILSDTGMGKTAFLVNLYLKYKQLHKRSNYRYDIKLIPLGASDAIDSINKISNKKGTILLLDAFDEDIQAIVDYQKRLNEILTSVKSFRKVIFTCRTQFFPTKDEEPRDTDDITFGENIRHSIHKLYLSPFDDKDVVKYLWKKYGLNFFKLFRALKMVKKSTSLMFRPMLLTYINELLNEKKSYRFSYEMYQVLIDNWIRRESRKPAKLDQYETGKYSKDLLEFSKSLSINLYEMREKRQGYSITKTDLHQLDKKNLIVSNSLTIEDKTGRSLLNRNSQGLYKFAHKSILEYFLALEIFNNPSFFESFDFNGMDATEKFYEEMVSKNLSCIEGNYNLKEKASLKPLRTISPKYLPELKELVIKESRKIKYEHLIGLKMVDKIIFYDEKFLISYLLYLFACFELRVSNNHSQTIDKERFKTYIYSYQEQLDEIKKIYEDFSIDKLKSIIEISEMDEKSKSLFDGLIHNFNLEKNISKKEFGDLQDLRNHIEDGKSFKVLLKDSFDYLKELKKLETYLPQATLIY